MLEEVAHNLWLNYLLAVVARELIFSRDCAITSTMANFFAIDALDFDFVRVFSSLFGATTGSMPKFWRRKSVSAEWNAAYSRERTVAASAFRNATVHGHTSVLETLDILLGVLRPAGLLCLTLRLVAEVEANLVSLVQLPLQIDVGVSLGKLFLLCSRRLANTSPGSTGFLTYGCNKVDVEVVQAKRTLKIVIGDIGDGLTVDLESLDGDVSFNCQ